MGDLEEKNKERVRAMLAAAQDSEGILALLAGGVDVAADAESALGSVVAGQAAPETFCWVFSERTPRSPRLKCRPTETGL